jgi:hypothetical protein
LFDVRAWRNGLRRGHGHRRNHNRFRLRDDLAGVVRRLAIGLIALLCLLFLHRAVPQDDRIGRLVGALRVAWLRCAGGIGVRQELRERLGSLAALLLGRPSVRGREPGGKTCIGRDARHV